MSASLPGVLVGVVLAGGESRRMGRDKALLCLPAGASSESVPGEPLAAAAARRLGDVVTSVVISDRGRALLPGFRSIEDAGSSAAPVKGPAAGLLGAARQFPGHALLVLACDLPAVPTSLLAMIAAVAPEADLVVPRHGAGQLEPLCARWGPAALDRLAGRAREGRFALHPVASTGGLSTHFIDERALRTIGDPATMLRNVNSPEDLDALREPYSS